jgi:hypothetical protein
MWSGNTLMLDIKKLRQEGLMIDYETTHYQWYKNKQRIPNGYLATYSAGDNRNNIVDTTAYYYLEILPQHGERIRTCEKKISLPVVAQSQQQQGITAYPNPVAEGTAVYLDFLELPQATVLEVYNILGVLCQKVPITENPVKIYIREKGIYLVKAANNTIKVIVNNNQ